MVEAEPDPSVLAWLLHVVNGDGTESFSLQARKSDGSVLTLASVTG